MLRRRAWSFPFPGNLIKTLCLSDRSNLGYWQQCPVLLSKVLYATFFFTGTATRCGFVFCSPLAGLYPPRVRGFLITHNDAPQSVGLLWTNDQSVAETSTCQHTTLATDKHPCPGGIRTHDRSRRAPVDPHLRPRGYWDRRSMLLFNQMQITCHHWQLVPIFMYLMSHFYTT